MNLVTQRPELAREVRDVLAHTAGVSEIVRRDKRDLHTVGLVFKPVAVGQSC